MSKNKEKEVDLGDISEIRKITKQSKEKYMQSLEEAGEKAFEKIVEDSFTKIKDAASKGKMRTYLYKWEYVEPGQDNPYTFNNFKIMHLLKESSLLQRLRNYFNPENKIDGYQVRWKKFDRRYDDEPPQYGIFVSWYQRQENKPPVTPEGEKEKEKEKEKKKWKKVQK